jgi:UDP-N-acetylmuramate dehydrogenase
MQSDAALAPLTTLGLGGPARHLAVVSDEPAAVAAVAWAKARGLDLLILGGGSNIVVGDAGFDGVVLRMAVRGLRFVADARPDRVLVHAAAGEPWDALVDATVGRGLAGIECLAGIPGLVGATPIQNVGAYGQDVSETIVGVRALDRATETIVELPSAACGFGYRDSVFKRQPAAYLILGVTFALTPGGAPAVRYPELAAYLQKARAVRGSSGPRGTGDPAPTLAEVRDAVTALRRRKSMLIDRTDPNHRSVGSFFTNPVVAPAAAADIATRAAARGIVKAASEVPQFPASDGQVKLSAAWLIEQAGFARGFRRGAVGLSSNHALALIHHGGGSTADLLKLAGDIRDAVRTDWGVTLVPEPTLVGTTLDG